MKILLVSPLPPPAGGIATWTEQYRAYCRECSVDLSVVNIALQGNRAANITNKRSIASEIKRTWSIFSDLRRQIRQNRPDVVHINSSCSALGLMRDLLCVTYVKSKKIPVVLHFHCTVQDQLPDSTLSNAMFRAINKKADRVIAMNTYSLNAVIAAGGGERGSVIPNFISFLPVMRPIELRETIRKIIFVGHVQRNKGAWEIFQVARLFPQNSFILVGPVAEEVAAWPCPENVVLLGSKSHQDTMALLQEADVFLFPSYSEGFSIALLEAMAVGLPSIATDVGANRDMLEAMGGVIVRKESVEDLADAIRRIERADVRKQMSQWSIQKVREQYGTERVVRQIFSVYESVVGRSVSDDFPAG